MQITEFWNQTQITEFGTDTASKRSLGNRGPATETALGQAPGSGAGIQGGKAAPTTKHILNSTVQALASLLSQS